MVPDCPNCHRKTDDRLLFGFCRRCVEDIDAEARPLVFTLNTLPGIQTIESCCGHGTEPFRIWFEVSLYDKSGLKIIQRAVEHKEWPQGERWTVCKSNMQLFTWILSSADVGPQVFGQSRLLCRHLKGSS